MKDEEQRRSFEVWVAIVAAYLGILGVSLSSDQVPLDFFMFGAGLVIGVALFHRFHGRQRSPGLFPAMIAAGLVILLSSLALLNGFQIHALNMDRDSIRRTILQGTELQLTWLKIPTKDMTHELENYYVSQADGGGALSQTVSLIENLRSAGKRYSNSANGAVFFETIDVHGDTAFVKTFEAYYEPKLEQKSDKPAGLDQLSGEQVYILSKKNNRWRIQTNPVPQKAPGTSTP